MPGNKIDSLRVLTVKVPIAFYRLGEDAGLTKKVNSLGVPTFNVSIMFHTL